MRQTNADIIWFMPLTSEQLGLAYLPALNTKFPKLARIQPAISPVNPVNPVHPDLSQLTLSIPVIFTTAIRLAYHGVQRDLL